MPFKSKWIMIFYIYATITIIGGIEWEPSTISLYLLILMCEGDKNIYIILDYQHWMNKDHDN